MKKNSTSKLIALMLLIALLSSCGSGSPSGDTTAADTADTTEAVPAETDRSQLADNLPEADFDGYVFRMLGRNDNFMYAAELGAAEQTGDVVDDAAYERDRKVMERYNIELVRDYQKFDTINTLVRQSVLADEVSYDLVLNHAALQAGIAAQGLLYDWYELGNVDFDKPWWSSAAISELAVKDHSYLATGDICISNIGVAMCIFYNKTLGERYQLENIYEVVNSGKWTYDYFNDVVKDIHSDLNGDGNMDDKDLFGFGNNIGSTLQPFVFSLGARFSEKNADRIPQLCMNNEKFIGVFEKIYNLHLQNEGVIALEDFQVPRTMFANSQIVFNTGAIYHSATLYRDMEDDIGILPFPKADESMERYYTCHDMSVSLAAVPAVISDPDRTGLIISALAAESYRTLTPAFYETALKVKYSRDDEMVQTLDMIRDGVTFDFVVLYGTTGSAQPLGACMKNLLKEGSTDFASYYAKNAPAAEAYLNELVDNYLTLDK